MAKQDWKGNDGQGVSRNGQTCWCESCANTSAGTCR
jgi:hypothetical protein